MRARDIMTSAVVTVGPEASVADVARLLIERRISAVPVVDADGAPVGIVSESDFLPRVEGRPGGPWWLRLFTGATGEAREYVKAHGRRVDEVMTRGLVTVGPDMSVGDVAHTLERHGVKRVPVVDGGRLIGLVSRADIVRALAARRDDAMPAPLPSDAAIREAVLAEIAGFAWAPSACVSVTVAGGVVSLYGIVANDAQREALQVAAENVPGVRSVEVHVRPWPTRAYAP